MYNITVGFLTKSVSRSQDTLFEWRFLALNPFHLFDDSATAMLEKKDRNFLSYVDR